MIQKTVWRSWRWCRPAAIAQHAVPWQRIMCEHVYPSGMPERAPPITGHSRQLRFEPDVVSCASRKYQLVFCYTIIERNNRQVLPVVRSSIGGDCVSTNTNPLDSVFPFDPYILKRYNRLETAAASELTEQNTFVNVPGCVCVR